MASIFKPVKSKYWHAAFRDRTGQRRNKSTRLPATKEFKNKALRVAEKFEEAARMKTAAHQLQRGVLQLMREIEESSVAAVSYAKFSADWVECRSKDVRAITIMKYKRELDRFGEFLGEERMQQDIVRISTEDIRRYRDELAAVIAPKTANHYLKTLRSAFGAAVKEGLMLANPVVGVEAVPVTRGPAVLKSRAFTVGELKTLLKVADGEWPGIVRVALYTGQRLGDIVRLKWDQVDKAHDSV